MHRPGTAPPPARRSRELHALVFDFDGVIVDSEPAHARSMALAFAELGIPTPPDMERTWHRFIGRGDRECIVEIAQDAGRPLDEAGVSRAVALKARAFQSAEVQALIRPFEATLALIRDASARMSVAVCSGSVRDTVHRGLDRLGLRDVLRAIVTCDDVPRNKPHPDPYLAAARALGVAPAAAAAIEDSPTGIASAHAAGLYVIGVAHTFPAERLTQAHEVHASTAAVRLDGPRG